MRQYLQREKQPQKSQDGKRGEQSMKSLTKQGANLQDIEVADISTFRRTARKYHIDFTVKRDNAADPPKWIVFFKAKDSAALQAAFNEYSKATLKRSKLREPIRAKLARFTELMKAVTAPVKNRDRGGRER
jgi:hypothetical protein